MDISYVLVELFEQGSEQLPLSFSISLTLYIFMCDMQMAILVAFCRILVYFIIV